MNIFAAFSVSLRPRPKGLFLGHVARLQSMHEWYGPCTERVGCMGQNMTRDLGFKCNFRPQRAPRNADMKNRRPSTTPKSPGDRPRKQHDVEIDPPSDLFLPPFGPSLDLVATTTISPETNTGKTQSRGAGEGPPCVRADVPCAKMASTVPALIADDLPTNVTSQITDAARPKTTSSVVCYSPMMITTNGIWQGVNPLEFSLPLFILQVAVIVVTTRLLVVLLKPFRQPRVIAEILVSKRLTCPSIPLVHQIHGVHAMPMNSPALSA